ncbi:MAG: hypothetical protein HY445_01210 [Candidatus Niyogibacteria bacterium]|nr:hypothetical protein [Candidatus Niyogibacteria bacterium]
MGILNKNWASWKFVRRFLLIIIIALALLYVTNVYLSPDAREDREARKYIEDLQRQYENDTYGGKTPEETLALFIDALEKGDIELASKYFVIDKQEEWRSNLMEIHSKGLLKDMIVDLHRPRNAYSLVEGGDVYIFDIYNDDNQLAVQINVQRIANGIWKIEDL